MPLDSWCLFANTKSILAFIWSKQRVILALSIHKDLERISKIFESATNTLSGWWFEPL